MADTPTPARDDYTVPGLVNQLRDQLDLTSAQLVELRDQLEPVLRPGDSSQVMEERTDAVEATRPDSPLVEQLTSQVQLVRVLQHRVTDLASRLQL
jgi:hypothetical protein